jgi:hypothetical protein
MNKGIQINIYHLKEVMLTFLHFRYLQISLIKNNLE